MYTASFGLRCSPFEDRADAAFFFPAAEHEEAIAAMQYEAQHGAGVGLILGETGTGKTILVRALSRRLTESEKVVVLSVPGNGAVDILREACKGFGVSLPSSLQDARGLARLRRHLSRIVREARRPILIIDQAEHLSPGDLNDVESLLELQDDRGRLLRVVLAAHPRFRSLLEQPAFGRLRQLAFTEHRLSNLCESEVAKYIRHRLSVAGAGDSEIFSEDAISAVYERSQGVPRVINQVCNAAMLAAYAEGQSRVTWQHVEGIQHRAETSSNEAANEVIDLEPVREPSRRIETGIWDFQTRSDDSSAAASKLTALIQQADRVAEGLKRRMPQTSDAVDQAESKVEQMLGMARERIVTLESRLSAATRRAEQAAAQVERAEHAFNRAEQIETRLTAFADQLAEQMESVQARVAEIMKYAAPLDDARNRLEGVIRQADLACGKIEQSMENGSTRITEHCEASHKTMQRSISTLLESSTQKMRSTLDGLQRESANLVENSERSIKSATAEYQQRITQIAQSAQKSADDLKQAGDQAKQEAKNVHDAADRARVLHSESTQVVARIGADTAAARQLSENIGVLISSADAKLSQLASCQAALTHLHDRLGRMLLTAHPLVERADEAIGQLDERVSHSEKAKTQLGEKVLEVTSQIERATQAGTRAAQECKGAMEAAQGAAQISRKLETVHEQASHDIASLQDYLTKSSAWLTRMESLSTTVSAAEQTSEKLAAVVASGTSLVREVPTLLESAKRQQAMLQETSEKARRETDEASGQMKTHLQAFRLSLKESESDLVEYQNRVGALEGEFQHIMDRADAAQKVATQVQTVVENAQNQAENLERVCVAVRKVFSGLSQASLNARNQAQELEQFVSDANQTAKSFQHWLERVRVGFDEMKETRTSRSTHVQTEVAETKLGILEREAEMLVDHEPGAAGAHLVEGGLDAATAQPYPSQAREIAQLIAKARKSKTGEAEPELANQQTR